MVIKDNTYDGPNLKGANTDGAEGILPGQLHPHKMKLATPADRFASFVIDFGIVLTPIFYMAIAPFQKAAKEAAMFEDEYQLQMAVILGALVVPLIVLFYQTVSTWAWGGTVGKRLMGLEIRDVWGGRLSLSQSAYRSIYWLVSWAAFGIPFLSTLSNVMRRPFHDRLSDSVVIALRPGRRAASPGAHEAAMAKGVYWAVGILAALVLTYQISLSIGDWQNQNSLIANLQDEGVLCAAVGDAQEEWPDENGNEPQRLSVALGLFAAGYIDIDCVDREIGVLYKSQEPSDLLYLAKSFVYSEDTELSDQYLKKVCEHNNKSDECKLSRIIEYVADGEYTNAESEFQNISSQAPVFVSIWGLQQSLSQSNFALAKSFLTRIPNIKSIGEFLTPARAKILWGLNKLEEATGVESAAYALVSDEGKFELASFMCFERIWQNCEEMKSQSCQQFVSTVDSQIEVLSDIQSSITYLRTWECQNQANRNPEDLLVLPIHSKIKKIAVNKFKSPADVQKQMDIKNTDERIVSEAYRRLLANVNDRNGLWQVADIWKKAKKTLGWAKIGQTLFLKFKGINDHGGGLIVVDQLIQNGMKIPASILEASILAAVKSGQEDRARGLLMAYMSIEPINFLSGDRKPAESLDLSSEKSEFIKSLKYLLEKEL